MSNSNFLSPINQDKLLSIEIFTRRYPSYYLCNAAKNWIRKNLPRVKIIEYDTAQHQDKWEELIKLYPEAAIAPQITATFKNGSRVYIGGYLNFTKNFLSSDALK